MPTAPRDSLSGLNGGPLAGRRVASSIIQHGPQERPAGVSTHPTRAGGRVQQGADPFPEGERGGNGRDTRSLSTPANPTSTDSSACAIGFFAHESIFHHARSSGVPRLGCHEDTAATDAACLEDRPNNHDGSGGGADSRDRGSSRPRDKLNASRLQTAWSDATHTLNHLAGDRYAGAFPPLYHTALSPRTHAQEPGVCY